MKAAIYNGDLNLEIKEINTPTINNTQALIRVMYSGICGSDIYHSSGRNPRVKPPVILGHEFMGEVIEIPNSYPIKLGDIVTTYPLLSCNKCDSCKRGYDHICENLKILGVHQNGGFAEMAVVPVDNLMPLPKTIKPLYGAMIEPLAVAMHAVRLSCLKSGDTVAIFGGGTIGILVGIISKKVGAKKVIIIEKNKKRRSLAKNMGFYTVDANSKPKEVIDELTGHKGADIVFECVGVAATAEMLTSITRIKGKIIIVGLFEGLEKINLLEISFKELQVIDNLTVEGIKSYLRQNWLSIREQLLIGYLN